MMVGDPADASTIISLFKSDPKYVGGGVGSGFKEAVLPYLDEITPLAKAMGAVNVIKKTARRPADRRQHRRHGLRAEP